MGKKVEWVEEAAKDLGGLDRALAERVSKKISWFSTNFDHVTPEPLSGDLKGTYKLRVGDWRVVYAVEGDSVTVLAVGHRKDIYR